METPMELNRIISSLLLTTISSSAFAFDNQEIVTLINKQVKNPLHHIYANKQNHTQLNWASLHGPTLGAAVNVVQMKNNAAVLFAYRSGSYGAIHKSSDGGKHWKALSAPKNITIWDLISIDENRLLLAADQNIYSSDDKGESWKLLANVGQECHKLFAPHPNLILLEVDRFNTSASLLRSLDGGKTWTPARLGLDLEQLIFQSGIGGNNNILLVATRRLNISTNNGMFWSTPEKWSKYRVDSLAISNTNEIYFCSFGSLYKSDAQGQSVNKINLDNVIRVKIDNNDKIYAVSSEKNHNSLYESLDHGMTWNLLHEFGSAVIYDLTLLDNGNIIVSTNVGLMEYNQSLRQVAILPITFSSSETIKVTALDENNFFAIDGWVSGPLWSSHDSGKSWTISRSENVADVSIFQNQLLELESNKNKNGTHLLASLDKGLTWSEIALPTKYCYDISSYPNTLILTCSSKQQYLTHNLTTWEMITNESNNNSRAGNPYIFINEKSMFMSNGSSIKRSDDDGKTWIPLLINMNARDTRITGYQDKILLTAINNAGIIKSIDGGKNWDLINNGIEHYQFTDIKALDESRYIIATDGGIYMTNDGGENWSSEDNGLDNLDVKTLFANETMLLAGTKGSGVFKASLK